MTKTQRIQYTNRIESMRDDVARILCAHDCPDSMRSQLRNVVNNMHRDLQFIAYDVPVIHLNYNYSLEEIVLTDVEANTVQVERGEVQITGTE